MYLSAVKGGGGHSSFHLSYTRDERSGEAGKRLGGILEDRGP